MQHSESGRISINPLPRDLRESLPRVEMPQTFSSRELNQLIQDEDYVNQKPDYAYSPFDSNLDHGIHRSGAIKSHEHNGEYYQLPDENHQLLISSPIIRTAVEVASMFGSRVSITGSLKSNILSYNGVSYKSRGEKRVLDTEELGDIDLRVSIPVSEHRRFLEEVKNLFQGNSEYEIKTSSSGNLSFTGIYIYKDGIEVGSIFFTEPTAGSEPEDYIDAQERSMFSNDKGVLLISKDFLQFHDPERTFGDQIGDLRLELTQLALIKNSSEYELINKFLSGGELSDFELYLAVRTATVYTKFIMQNLTISNEIHNIMRELFREIIFKPDLISGLNARARDRFLAKSLQQYCKLADLKGDGSKFLDYLTQYPYLPLFIPGVAERLRWAIPSEYPYIHIKEPQELAAEVYATVVPDLGGGYNLTSEETGSALIMLNFLFNNLDRTGSHFPPSKSVNLTLGFIAAASLYAHEWISGVEDQDLATIVERLIARNLIEQYRSKSKADQYGVDLTVNGSEVLRIAGVVLAVLRNAQQVSGSPKYSREKIYEVLRKINSHDLNLTLGVNAEVSR